MRLPVCAGGPGHGRRNRGLLQDGTCQGFRGQDFFLTLLLCEISHDQAHALKVIDSEAITRQKCRYECTVDGLKYDLSPAAAAYTTLEKRHKALQLTW